MRRPERSGLAKREVTPEDKPVFSAERLGEMDQDRSVGVSARSMGQEDSGGWLRCWLMNVATEAWFIQRRHM